MRLVQAMRHKWKIFNMPQFMIELSGLNGILLFLILLFLSMFLFRIKLASKSLGFTSKNSNQAQGIFIALVIIHHISQRLTISAIDNFKGYGYLAVGVFFLLSGYGLIKSLKKRKDYMQGFLKKKIVVILLPFVLINAVCSIFFQFTNKDGLPDFLLFFTSLKLIDGTSWFVVSIFIFYSAFYVLFTNVDRVKGIVILFVFTVMYILLCRYLELGTWVYKSVLCFPVGALIGNYECFFNTVLKKFKLFWFGVIASVIAILVIMTHPELLLRLPTPAICVIFAISVYFVLSVVELNSPVSDLLGRLSLDAYLIHMKLMLIFSYVTALSSFVWFAFYFFSLIALSLFFNRAHRKIGSYI
jgi:membrane-bound acyltransferase YfiQ involved in biofilm formation